MGTIDVTNPNNDGLIQKKAITDDVQHPNALVEKLSQIPGISSGTIPMDRAMQWLELALRVYSQSATEKLIDQASGFGAKDIRTLIAHERNEYFPDDSAAEIYNKKWLYTLPAPSTPSIERERILTNITREYLLNNYNIERDYTTEKKMSSSDPARKANWLLGQPGLVGLNGTNRFVFDIQFSDNTDTVSQSDIIRLHYYDLVANNSGINVDNLSLVKVFIDDTFADSIVSLAKISPSAEKNLTQFGEFFKNLPESKFNIHIHQIQKQPELYREIVTTGQKHWANICQGHSPQVKKDPPLHLPEPIAQLYVENGKRFVAATQTLKVAEQARNEAVKEFVNSTKGYEISENFTPPYLGALLRKYDHFDAEGAAVYMENKLRVDPIHLRTQTINYERLKDSFIRMGGDISQFYELGGPDKKLIETTAQQLKFDLSSFYSREMRPIVNPKTRGPIFEALKESKESIVEMIQGLNIKVSQSPQLDNKCLYVIDDKQINKQAVMKL